MLSRVADSLYWLGRNVERAEMIARILDVNYNRAMDFYAVRDGHAERLWRSVWQCAGFVDEPELPSPTRFATEALALCAFSTANPSSVRSCIRIARANALANRSVLTTEVWETINALYLDVESQDLRGVVRNGPTRFLRRVRDSAQAFAGICAGTLTHTDRWQYLLAGRFFERAYMTVRILAATDIEGEPWPESQRVLEMCCASEPFAEYSSHAGEPRDVLAFLILHPQSPRSVRFAIRQLDDALHAIGHTPYGTFANEAQRQLGRLRADLDFSSIDDTIGDGVGGFVARMDDDLRALHEAIVASYNPSEFSA